MFCFPGRSGLTRIGFTVFTGGMGPVPRERSDLAGRGLDVSEPLGVDYGRGVADAWAAIAVFVPKLVGFLVILVVGFLIARVLQRITNAALERVGFDRAVERGGVKQALARTEYDASDIIAKLVYYAVLLFTLIAAFNVFGPNPVSTLLQGLVGFLPNIAVAIIIVVVAAAIAKAVKDVVSGLLGGLGYGNALASVASAVVLALGVIAALNQIGIATAITTPILVTVLATVGGILVVGVGGGLVRPMQQRWGRWLDSAEAETANARQQIRANRGAPQGQPGQEPTATSTLRTAGGRPGGASRLG